MQVLPVSQRLRLIGRAMVGLFSDQAWAQAEGVLAGVIGPGGQPPERGTREYLNSYTTMPWVRAIAGKIAYTVAATRWKLVVVRRSGRATRIRSLQRNSPPALRAQLFETIRKQPNTVVDEILEHPMLDALYNANAYHTGLGLRKLMMLYIDLIGDCFLLKERNAVGAVIGLWPIPPHWVTTTPSQASPVYEVSYRGWQRSIPEADILWLCDPNPVNPYGRGTGHVQAVGDELETDEYAAKMVKQVFFNRARPDLLISPKEGMMEKEDVSRLEEHWNTRLQGFHRAFKPFFLRRPVEVKEFEQNFQNLQFRDLREQDRDIIMQVFGIPPEILGVLENSNRATIESADYLFTKYVVVPRLEFFRDQFQERLVPEYDDRLILEYESPVMEDKDFQLKAKVAAPWALSLDEWRACQGLSPSENGDGHLHAVPSTVAIVDNLTEEAERRTLVPTMPSPVLSSTEESVPAAAWYRPLQKFTTGQLREVNRLLDKVNL